MPEPSDKPSIVMIHGAFCGGWVFDHFKNHFSDQGFDAHAPDLPFHGPEQSGKPDPQLGALGLMDYVRHLEEFLERFDQPPVLMGHSMGGLLCQILASRKMARACVLLAPCAPWGLMPTTMGEYANAFGVAIISPVLSRDALLPNFEVAVEQSLHQLPPEHQKSVYSRFVPESGRSAFEIFHWGFDLARASYVAPRKVTVPILTLTGGQDRINPPSTVRKVARRYRHPHNHFEVFTENSHWLIGEDGWQDIASMAQDWINDLPEA